MNNDIAIKVENLSKIYKLYDSPIDRMKEALHWRGKKYHKDFYALNDVSFEIKKGETVGIIGKNGSGKSTLLKIITGVLTPTSGRVTVNGRISALLELGAGFNPEYTGIENIYFQGNLMGYTREQMDARVDDILTFADIGDFIHQPVKMYSSGMFARLAFAVAINVEPDILIVDEALSTGDFMFQFKCFKKINDLKKSGVTILFVSHSSQLIIEQCDEAIFINNGIYIFGSDDIKKVIYYYEEYSRTGIIRDKEDKFTSTDVKTDANTNIINNVSEHRMGTYEAIIKDVIFQQKSVGAVCDSSLLYSGRSTLIKLVIEAKKDFENVVLGMSLRNVNGLSIWGDNSLNAMPDTMKLCAGINVFNFRINLLLRPGEYLFYIGLADFSRSERVELDQRWPAKKIQVVSLDPQAEGYVHDPLVYVDFN